MVRRLARGLRGVEICVVPAVDPAPDRPDHQPWILGSPIGQTIGLGSMLVVATMAIAYSPWPLVLVMLVVVAATWCWRLESRYGS